jgi:8-oxo-dGTP diphosphatase
MNQPTVRVGLAVWIVHDNKVLMDFRIKPHGGGTWAPPGGHLELNESWEDCARREAKEEAGLDIKDVSFFTATNDIFPETGKHYVTLHMQARSYSPEFINSEPEKYKDFGWYTWENLPQPTFPGISTLPKPTYLI